MADPVNPTQEIVTIQTEFNVPTAQVLAQLIDPAQVAEGDLWSFVDAGGVGLVIVRKRVTFTHFDENGDPIPDPPAEPPPEEPPAEETPPEGPLP